MGRWLRMPSGTITVSRIALVKPTKADAITNMLVQLARSGQIRQRVSEQELIDLLDQVEQRTGGDNEPKIIVRPPLLVLPTTFRPPTLLTWHSLAALLRRCCP